MATEPVLTEFHIDNIAAGLYGSRTTPQELAFARAIEQAVLQSPEMQQRMESYAAARVQEMLHEEAKPDNIKRAEYYGDGYADGWKAALEEAARIVAGYVGCEEIAGEVSALIPSTPA